MTKITRTHLIKAIVAEEMRLLDQATVNNESYAKTLEQAYKQWEHKACLLYTSPSPRDRTRSRMPSSA